MTAALRTVITCSALLLLNPPFAAGQIAARATYVGEGSFDLPPAGSTSPRGSSRHRGRARRGAAHRGPAGRGDGLRSLGYAGALLTERGVWTNPWLSHSTSSGVPTFSTRG